MSDKQQPHTNTPSHTGGTEWVRILRQYWGYDSFRGIQEEIINSIGSGHDTLGLMPTGGGKSITFQVPAMAMDGLCLVVTPLISLMKDQVEHLRQHNIPAYAIYSGLGHGETVKILDNCIFGDIKFLYVSPERLQSPFFLTKLRHIKVSFITVDEAHCISQWGYDFRPSYLRIAELRKVLPDKPVLAVTATATPEVVEDIQRKLAFREGSQVFRMSFRRDNLTYVVRQAEDREAEILHILNNVPGTAIIYTMSRRHTRDISRLLNEAGITASYYHAGLDVAVKAKRQHDWQTGAIRVIVATNAFGMGIDKPDVRLVIHADVPSSIEAYFQEAGRAGRDGKRSYAVLLTTKGTVGMLKRRVKQSFPDKSYIRDVYEHLAYYYEIGVGMGCGHTFRLHLDDFCAQNRYFPVEADTALKILDNAGYINYQTEPDDNTRVKFLVGRDDLYRIHHLQPEEDAIIDYLLRYYEGLFVDYQYIDETFLASVTGTTKERVRMFLSDLRQQNILTLIPPRTEPQVTYLIDRVDGCDVKLSRMIYDDLRDVMKKHIDAMVTYIEHNAICRQTMLLDYFGEKDSTDCGTCDVCCAHRRH